MNLFFLQKITKNKMFTHKIFYKKNRSPIVRWALVALLFLMIILTTYCLFFVYDESLSESARLSKKFNNKIEMIAQSNVTSFELKNLTDFEWDVVCIYGEEGEAIDLKNPNLIEHIGYKPTFLARSTYYLPYDFSGLLFSNSKTKKIRVLHRLRQDVDGLFYEKLFFSDVEYLGHLKNPDPTSDYYPLHLNRCYKAKKTFSIN